MKPEPIIATVTNIVAEQKNIVVFAEFSNGETHSYRYPGTLSEKEITETAQKDIKFEVDAFNSPIDKVENLKPLIGTVIS